MKFEWEVIDNISTSFITYRMRVPNGWLVAVDGGGDNPSIIFFPDPDKEWIDHNDPES